MTAIRTLIIDDEPLARDGIRLLLTADKQFEIIGECANGREAVSAIKKLHPDLVFLDVQMPELDGFGVLKAIREEKLPLVVFVTAFDKFAIDAFEAHALDYILKPVNPIRFAATIARIKKRLNEQEVAQISQRLVELLNTDLSSVAAMSTRSSYLNRFTLKTGDRLHFVDAAEVDWIEAEDYYAKLHVGKLSHLIRETLSHLEKQLDPVKFVRIHRSTIVNIEKVKELKAHFRGEYFVILANGTKLKSSRTYHDAVVRILSGR